MSMLFGIRALLKPYAKSPLEFSAFQWKSKRNDSTCKNMNIQAEHFYRRDYELRTMYFAH